MRQQQALLQALWLPAHQEAIDALAAGDVALPAGTQWQRGLQAYRSNGHALAKRALAAAYPVVAQLLGEENLAALAQSLWRAHPPLRGDIAQWGEALARHIASLPGLHHEEPYLPDVARIEWLLHTAAAAADASPELASLRLLTEHDPTGLTLMLSPGWALLASDFPAVSIVLAHTQPAPSLEEAGARLRGGVKEIALVWREGLQPRLRQALPGEPSVLGALAEGRSLADALQAAPELDFGAWLAVAVQAGLVLGARAL